MTARGETKTAPGAGSGQASVALIATVPAILAAAALLLQVALVGYAAVSASHAARAAARAEHTGADPEAAGRAAVSAMLAESLAVDRGARMVSVRLRAPRLFPLGPAITVGAEARLGPAAAESTAGGAGT